MGTISRHAGAPFADGETLAGADLEGDFATVYAAVNGNLDAANLADGAVTTPKLAATAVTQAKMTSGAATASELVYTDSGLNLSNGTNNVGTAISHTVGNPARHVVLMVSFTVTITASGVVNLKILRDGSALPGYTGAMQWQNPSAAGWTTNIVQTFVDTTPTPGATHSYQVQGGNLGATVAIAHFVFFALEPRS